MLSVRLSIEILTACLPVSAGRCQVHQPVIMILNLFCNFHADCLIHFDTKTWAHASQPSH
jgi:hypothetical protein